MEKVKKAGLGVGEMCTCPKCGNFSALKFPATVQREIFVKCYLISGCDFEGSGDAERLKKENALELKA